MSKVDQLLKSYGTFIGVPWRDEAPDQRVIFCVYSEKDELRLRAKIGEFEIATQKWGHEWVLFDLTPTFAEWLTSLRYAQSYFKKPQHLEIMVPEYLEFIVKKFSDRINSSDTGDNTVVALQGVGSLFGFLRVKELVGRLAPLFKGRLLVFFPGNYEKNNYRLLDGYDGWNYLAITITTEQNF